MTMKFNPLPKGTKQKLIVTIDSDLMDMIKEVMEGYKTNISSAVSDIFEYFKNEIWDKELVNKKKNK